MGFSPLLITVQYSSDLSTLPPPPPCCPSVALNRPKLEKAAAGPTENTPAEGAPSEEASQAEEVHTAADVPVEMGATNSASPASESPTEKATAPTVEPAAVDHAEKPSPATVVPDAPVATDGGGDAPGECVRRAATDLF